MAAPGSHVIELDCQHYLSNATYTKITNPTSWLGFWPRVANSICSFGNPMVYDRKQCHWQYTDSGDSGRIDSVANMVQLPPLSQTCIVYSHRHNWTCQREHKPRMDPESHHSAHQYASIRLVEFRVSIKLQLGELIF